MKTLPNTWRPKLHHRVTQRRVPAAARTTKEVKTRAARAPDAAMFKLLQHEPAEPRVLVPAEEEPHPHTHTHLIEKPARRSLRPSRLYLRRLLAHLAVPLLFSLVCMCQISFLLILFFLLSNIISSPSNLLLLTFRLRRGDPAENRTSVLNLGN